MFFSGKCTLLSAKILSKTRLKYIKFACIGKKKVLRVNQFIFPFTEHLPLNHMQLPGQPHEDIDLIFRKKRRHG